MKRFIDTELWRKEWYRLLTPAEKEAWRYLTDTCDNVGMIRVDVQQAEYVIGAEIDWKSLPDKLNGNIIILPNGKWWLRDFCDFQYGDLKETNKPHLSYIALLKKHGLWACYSSLRKENKGLGYPLQGVQDKIRKGLELEKEKEEDTPSEPFAELHNKFNGVRSKRDRADPKEGA